MRPGLEKRKNNNEKRDMETTVKTTKRNNSTKRIPNSKKTPRNKYIAAALSHQDSFIVYDPNFML